MQCLSAKNKNSDKRCCRKALKDLNFCGLHIRSKTKKFWIDVNDLDNKLIKFQSLFRGWIIRDSLKLGGPGVLKREERHNEEDLVTADQVSPIDYFGFLEGGKVFWFDVRTIYQWSSQNLEPTNPYTKVPLTIEDRKRLKKLVARREFLRLGVYHDPKYFKNCDQIKFLFYQIIQILNENLYADIPESYFFLLNEFDIIELSRRITLDSREWKFSKHPLIQNYYTWLVHTSILIEADFYRGFIPFLITIFGILRNHKVQYDFSFKFMAARSNLI
jgi:hypothetical protein